MNQYTTYANITKEILDSVETGDLIKVNNWVKPMRVKGVSENYFIMTQKLFGKIYYSVCEKKILQPETFIHNRMIGGEFHCSTDNMIFGYIPEDFDYEHIESAEQYDFENLQWIESYLKAFEDGKIELSQRRGMVIDSISIKKK